MVWSQAQGSNMVFKARLSSLFERLITSQIRVITLYVGISLENGSLYPNICSPSIMRMTKESLIWRFLSLHNISRGGSCNIRTDRNCSKVFAHEFLAIDRAFPTPTAYSVEKRIRNTTSPKLKRHLKLKCAFNLLKDFFVFNWATEHSMKLIKYSRFTSPCAPQRNKGCWVF